MKLTGKTFGIYEIREQLGRGGMGTVFKAYDPTLDRFVALKVLPAQLARDESFVTRFQQEARALAKLRHPHLIHIYAVGESEGYNYFAMELLDGQDLAAILRSRQTLPAKVAVHLLGQVMSGLHKAHEIGMVHRDIKPGNIMIDRDGRAVLMDFGLAKDQYDRSLTTDGSIVGTPEYMSPEQAQGGAADCRSDIYALGVVAYEVLAGAPPFAGKTAFAVLRQHVETPPGPLDKAAAGTPPALVQVVHKMLDKSPDDRYPNVVALALELVKIRRTPALLSLARLAQKQSGSGTVQTKPVTPAAAGPSPSGPAAVTPPTELDGPTAALAGGRSVSRAAPVAPITEAEAAPPETAVSVRPFFSGRRRVAIVVGAVLLALMVVSRSRKRRQSASPQAPAQSAPARGPILLPPPPGVPESRYVIEADKLKLEPVRAPRACPVTIVLKNGESTEGELEWYDPESRCLVGRSPDGQRQQVPLAKVKEVRFHKAKE